MYVNMHNKLMGRLIAVLLYALYLDAVHVRVAAAVASDAAAECTEDTDISYARLQDGPVPWEGRVELFHDGVWATFCGLLFQPEEAAVVCRELGYAGGAVRSQTAYGESSDRWPFSVKCDGIERQVRDCQQCEWEGEFHYCRNFFNVGVSCTTVQLFHGDSPREGHVQVIHNGAWEGVCGEGWDDVDAAVVCKELHYMGGVAWTAGDYGETNSNTRWLQNVSCDGSEGGVSLCGHAGWRNEDCGTSGYAGVTCQIAIRLEGSAAAWEGRVEVYHSGTWGTVYDGGTFDKNSAGVVCRELGYTDGIPVTSYPPPFGVGSGAIWFQSLSCTGAEQRLVDCEHGGWEVPGNVTHDFDASVRCTSGHGTDEDVPPVISSTSPPNTEESKSSFSDCKACTAGLFGSVALCIMLLQP